MSKIRTFRFTGGPYDGWEGEYVDRDEDVIRFGPPGEQVYCYRRRRSWTGRRTRADHFRYDRHLSKLAMLEAGFSPDDADTAGDGPSKPSDAPSYVQKVEVRRDAARWLLVVESVVVDERPLADITDAADAKAWVAEVMIPQKESA